MFFRLAVVSYRLDAVLAVTERIYKLHGTGAVQRNARYQVLQTVGLQLLHEALHAARFELEHAVGVALGNKSVRARVLIAYHVEIYFSVEIFANIVDTLLDICQRHEREEVHFEHAERLYFLCDELRRNVVSVSGKRNVVRNSLLTDNYARGVNTRLAGHALHFQRHIDNAAQRVVGLVNVAKLAVSRCFKLAELALQVRLFVLVGLRVEFGLNARNSPT